MEEDIKFTDLLEDLADEELLDEISEDTRFGVVTDDNVNDFVLEYGSRLVKDGMDAIEKVKPKITSGQDADEISALSELMRAMNSTLGTLTKISLQNKKELAEKEVRELAFTHKKELGPMQKTQIVIGTREDIFNTMNNKEKIAEGVIDVEEIPHEND